jgi:uncharacterized protein
MKRPLALACLAALVPPACTSSDRAATPRADHHAHLLSPAAAPLANEPPLPAIELPAELQAVFRERARAWNDAAGLAALLTEDCLVLEPRGQRWIRGREDAAAFLAQHFAKAHSVTPVACSVDGAAAFVAGYFTRPRDDGSTRFFGNVLTVLRRQADGAWRIAAETPSFPGPDTREPILAEQLLAQLDEAGIERAAVLSLAYWFGSAEAPPGDEPALVRAENDWTAAQAARFPARLVAFCSVNPLKPYAVAEIERCAALPQVRGVKLHFGNSDVDLLDPAHVEKVRQVFAAADALGLGLIVHLWTGPDYGRAEAGVFLEQLLPAAPHVTVQVAHFAGGGPGYTDEALEVFADAIAAGDTRTRRLLFDIATVADSQPKEVLAKLAERIRQVGPERVLFGTDMGPPAARISWMTFRTTVPLTDAEFATIAGNVAPYLR